MQKNLYFIITCNNSCISFFVIIIFIQFNIKAVVQTSVKMKGNQASVWRKVKISIPKYKTKWIEQFLTRILVSRVPHLK